MSHSAPIILTEIPRSGAPIVAHVLRVCGAWAGTNDDWPAKIDQEGNNKRVRDVLVRPLFRGLGANTLGLDTLPDIEACKGLAKQIAATWREQMKSILEGQGYEPFMGPWVYRGADALLAWPIWVEAFPNARWVMVRRDNKSIAEACERTGYMKSIRDADSFDAWVKGFMGSLAQMNASGHPVKSVWPGEFLHGKMAGLKQLILELGLTWDARKVQNELIPILWSNGVYELEGAH